MRTAFFMVLFGCSAAPTPVDPPTLASQTTCAGLHCVATPACACRHGGRCMADGCDCANTGYTGATCETNVDECALGGACSDHGTCTDTAGGFSCACDAMYTGARCESACADAFPADADCDGHAAFVDCDDHDPLSTYRAIDADCDGVDISLDCNDRDETSTTRATDGDCDGVVTSRDCLDDDALSTTLSTDADCDGVLSAADCDDHDVSFGARASDNDCDGHITAVDCDDGDPGSTWNAVDADCDGVLTALDCDDSKAGLGAKAQDVDCDGVVTAKDCDDADPLLLDRVTPSICLVAGNNGGATCKRMQNSKIVFFLGPGVGGNLGGPAGAAGKCDAAAMGRGYCPGYKAWLSTTVELTPASTFTQSSVPYRLPNGTQVADDWADLTDGSLDHGIDQDVAGASVGSRCTLSNTNGSGGWANGSYGTCGQWTNTSGNVFVGSTADANLSWTYSGYYGCDAAALGIYCFEQ